MRTLFDRRPSWCSAVGISPRNLASITLLAALLLSGITSADAAADETQKKAPSTLGQALAEGDFTVALRYRFEGVDDDAFTKDAEASTLRTTLAYRSSPFRGWSIFVEAEDVTAIFDDDGYNNLGRGSADNNGVRDRPVVADPALTEINQAYLRWQGESCTVTAGKQEINLGDQRFVGAVGWRQNHQSFDAFRFAWKASTKATLDISHLRRVNRIFGDRLDLEGNLLFAPFELAEGHRLTPYGFWLDFDNPTSRSTATYGLEYAGKVKLSGGGSLVYELEIAQQDDHGSNPVTVDAQYGYGSVGYRSGALNDQGTSWGFDITLESLGGEAGKGSFQTPLATLHKWNGWADKFLSTPGTGLETLYLRLRGSFAERFRWMLIYHDFQSDSGDIDYGTELDGELVYRSSWKQTFALKVASYDAEDFSTDTTKYMLSTAYRF